MGLKQLMGIGVGSSLEMTFSSFTQAHALSQSKRFAARLLDWRLQRSSSTIDPWLRALLILTAGVGVFPTARARAVPLSGKSGLDSPIPQSIWKV